MSGDNLESSDSLDAETLAAFVEGRLTHPERVEVVQALVTDAELRSRYQSFVDTLEPDERELAPELPGVEAFRGGEELGEAPSGRSSPRSSTPSMLRTLAPGSPPPSLRPPPGGWFWVTAAGLAIAVTLFFVWRILGSGNGRDSDSIRFVVREPGIVVFAEGDSVRVEGVDSLPLDFGDEVRVGDSLSISPESRLGVLVESRLKWGREIGESSGGNPSPSVLEEVVKAFHSSMRDREARLQQILGARLRSSNPSSRVQALYPCGEVQDFRPRFRWHPGDLGDEESIRIVLLRDRGEELFRRVVSARDGEWAYPADASALEAGVRYLWEVRGMGEVDFVSRRSFYTLTLDEREEVEELTESLDDWFGEEELKEGLLLPYLRERNLVGLALEVVTGLRRLAPDDRFLLGEEMFCRELLRAQ